MSEARTEELPREGLCVAIAGATGAVGEVLLRVLEERAFPIRELRPLASRRSLGQSVTFCGQAVAVAEARPEAFDGDGQQMFVTADASRVTAKAQ